MRAKAAVARVLKSYPPLFRTASRLYHAFNRGFAPFDTLSPGLPDALAQAFRLAREEAGQSPGDYFEFGLYRGYSFAKAFELCRELGLDDTRFFGFDSFEGLPRLDPGDEADGRFFHGQFACSMQTVEKNLRDAGVDESRVRLVEGYYEDSLSRELKTEFGSKRAAVVLLDCDLYSSTRTALGWLDDLLTAGSILLFDDWFSHGDDMHQGQPRALREFLEARPQLRAEPLGEFPRHGKTFVLRAG
jgi:hypothetical protein